MRKLAPGQWWSYCGETDMGQTLPFLCTECGGTGQLAESHVCHEKATALAHGLRQLLKSNGFTNPDLGVVVKVGDQVVTLDGDTPRYGWVLAIHEFNE